ncbi:hypothetical protein MMC13_006010 [Lambiella insularis]|nr:hypothetical protein [Lambiella insularis]
MRDKQPLSRAFDHLVHCLDILRQEIMCTAADTPIAGKAAGGLGTNPTRLCRSWDALEAFAQQYNACYSFANESASAADLPRIERFRYCPPDSPYRAAMEAVFGPSLFPGEDTEE